MDNIEALRLLDRIGSPRCSVCGEWSPETTTTDGGGQAHEGCRSSDDIWSSPVDQDGRPSRDESWRAIRSVVARHRELVASHDELAAFRDLLRTAMARGVGDSDVEEPDIDVSKAAKSIDELAVALSRWKAVGAHGLVGTAFYRRDECGGVEFVRNGTPEEDDAYVTVFQTSLRAMLRWQELSLELTRISVALWRAMVKESTDCGAVDGHGEDAVESWVRSVERLCVVGDGSRETGGQP